ncbi:hypothetical protein COO60DRAFT_1479642, partial [Scenedesmus sp. NREL 46B-D3]
QLLLRFLPFRGCSKAVGSTTQQHQHPHNRHALLEELQRNPLWRFSSLDEQQQLQRTSLAKALPQQAHDALLDYVRMAAVAEHPQQPGHKQRGQRSPADAAAELHALYALAVVHVASQQQEPQRKDPGNGQGSLDGGEYGTSLDDNEFLGLLKAYVSLDQAASSDKQQHSKPQQGSGGGQQQQAAAAAAVHALYAFAQLADSVQQKQKAPGELVAHTSMAEPAAADGVARTAHRSKQPGSAPGWRGDSSSRVDSQHDLQVLLKLAQLSMHP